MLILIAGISGGLGQLLLRSAVSRDYQVRGLGRSPDKLPAELRSALESFVVASNFHDIPAIVKAVAGVDAVIAAYANVPGLTLEGQLILFRVAERAGVKRYVATSWNYDWTKIPLGKHESYDEFIMFKHHIELAPRTINPIYIFTGILAEFMFRAPSDMSQLAGYSILGPDAADYTVDIVTSTEAEKGGIYSIMSDAGDVFQIAKIWKDVTGKDIEFISAGDVKQLEEYALAERKSHAKHE